MFYNDPQKPSNQPTFPSYTPMPDPMQGRPTPITQEVEAVPLPYMPPATPYYSPATPYYPPVQPQKRKRSGLQVAALIALICLFTLVFGVGLFSGWEFAITHSGASTSSPTTASSTSTSSGSSSNTLEVAREAAIAAVEPAVVQINVTTTQAQEIGSGVIIDSKGDIVTNDHVVNGAVTIQVVLSTGTTESAQIVGTSVANDLAVIRIQPFANMKFATLGNSSQLTVGEDVLAIGNPLGYTQTVTHGVVSALNRSEPESSSVTLNGLIQTDAPINPGNSGGALVNLQGQVVGIPTLGANDSETHTPANGIGFAISSNQVKTITTQILQQAGN